MPASPEGGTDEIVGTLTFGVGTSVNNRMRGAKLLHLNTSGYFTTRFDGVDFPRSYIDSGTETYLLPMTVSRGVPGWFGPSAFHLPKRWRR